MSWYGSQDARTAVSPERGDMGARTDPRQRLLDRGRGFKPRGKNSFTDEKRGHASRRKHENYVRHHLPAIGPQTQTSNTRFGRGANAIG